MSFPKTNGFGFTVTGLNGHITALGISFSIWLVVILGCLSFALFFLKTFSHLDIPKAAGFIPWMPALSLGRFQC